MILKGKKGKVELKIGPVHIRDSRRGKNTMYFWTANGVEMSVRMDFADSFVDGPEAYIAMHAINVLKLDV